MSKKRDIDRLAHFLLKFTVVEIKNDLKSKNSDSDIISTLRLVATIMQKAESYDYLKFSKKDSNETTVADICKIFNIDLKDFNVEDKKISDEDIREDLKKAGIKDAKIFKINVSDENSKAIKDMLESIIKKEGKK